MSVVVENVRLEIGEEEGQVLPRRVAKRLGLSPKALGEVDVVRRALDARKKDDIHWTVHVALPGLDAGHAQKLAAQGLVRAGRKKVKDPFDRQILDGVSKGQRPLPEPPLVIGSGQGGLFAAWLLAREGLAPIVLERGPAVSERVRKVNAFDRGGAHDPEANILFGEGGAGTFSDGKLTTRGRTPLVELVHDLLVRAKAPAEIKVQAKPHVGTDRLRAVLVYLRRELEALGGTFRFGARVDDLLLDGVGRVAGVRLAGGETLRSQAVVLAIGHSARDTYRMLHARGLTMEFKPFQLGLRVEHPQELIDRGQFGGHAGRLPVAEYVLNDKRRGVFSFCMCPGGTLMASVSEAGFLCTNGMSRRLRDSGWANSGLVFTADEHMLAEHGLSSEHPLAGVELQRVFEQKAYALGGGSYDLPAQRVPDFVAGKVSAPSAVSASSYPRGLKSVDLREVLPRAGAEAMRQALGAFGRRIPGYDGSEGLLVGPETRGSSPVRIPRDPATRESVSTPGLYPVGEGAGYAGGIMSAAIDGLRSAAAVASAFSRA